MMLLGTGFAAQAASELKLSPPPLALLLVSYHQGLAWSDDQVSGFKKALGDAKLDLRIEYLDTKHIRPSPAYFEQFERLLIHKYGRAKPAILLASDDDALDLALQLRADHFANIPILFSGIGRGRKAELQAAGNISGIFDDVDIYKNIDLALKLRPQTRRLVFIHDQSRSSLSQIDSVRQALRRYSQYQHEFLSELSAAELQQRLGRLGEQELVFIFAFNRDAQGQVFSHEQSTDLWAAASKAPLIAQWDINMRPGVLGGRLVTGRAQGQTLADLLRQWLQGSSLDKIPMIDGLGTPVFDFAALQHWRVREADLPAGALLINKPANWFDQLRPVLGLLLSILIGASIIIIMLLQLLRVKRRSQIALQRSESNYRELFNASSDAVSIHDIDSGAILKTNQQFSAMYGFNSEGAAAEPHGAAPLQIEDISANHAPFTRADALAWFKAAADDGAQLFEWQAKDAQGKLFWVEISLHVEEIDGVRRVVASARDVTERRAAQDEIRNLAFYDPLTRLPNRRLLLDRLKHSQDLCARHQQRGALLFVDLDHFKNINDTAGHFQGDLLLQAVALRLSACVREGDTVARLGGDEFVVMLEDLHGDELDAATQAQTVGRKILATLDHSFEFGSQVHHSSASVGVTLFGGALIEGIDEPMKRADLAMYQAKAEGRNLVRFFDPQMQSVVNQRAALETDLREAVQAQQFELHYQAQIAAGGRVLGSEALLRWTHGRRGAVSPADFIPLAEDTGLILPLGTWVLETACAQLALWAKQAEFADLTLSVNVSARQFRQVDFVELVLGILARSGARPERLKLELTESMLVADVEAVIATMNRLKAHGVGFSLDDFGTGYSSLSYLKRLPLEQLKIDQGFVRDLLTDPNDAAIAKMLIALAATLGLTVIAEGVETEAQRDFLASQGCLCYQGYLFSRPLALCRFEEFVKAQRATAASLLLRSL
jgi:diguanylate cyclase (GGDEF)-like protein/PAS domain S-box-containing protein